MNLWYDILNLLHKTLSCDHLNNRTEHIKALLSNFKVVLKKKRLREDTFAEKPVGAGVLYATLTKYSFIESNGATSLIVTFIPVVVSVKVPLK